MDIFFFFSKLLVCTHFHVVVSMLVTNVLKIPIVMVLPECHACFCIPSPPPHNTLDYQPSMLQIELRSKRMAAKPEQDVLCPLPSPLFCIDSQAPFTVGCT